LTSSASSYGTLNSVLVQKYFEGGHDNPENSLPQTPHNFSSPRTLDDHAPPVLDESGAPRIPILLNFDSSVHVLELEGNTRRDDQC
jgi:hypothetical protein